MAVDKKENDDKKVRTTVARKDKAASPAVQEGQKPKRGLLGSRTGKVVRKETKKDGAPARRAGFSGVRRFFEDTLKELKKVHWPTRREVVIYTSVVLVSVTLVGVVIWIFDSILSQVLGLVIG